MQRSGNISAKLGSCIICGSFSWNIWLFSLILRSAVSWYSLRKQLMDWSDIWGIFKVLDIVKLQPAPGFSIWKTWSESTKRSPNTAQCNYDSEWRKQPGTSGWMRKWVCPLRGAQLLDQHIANSSGCFKNLPVKIPRSVFHIPTTAATAKIVFQTQRRKKISDALHAGWKRSSKCFRIQERRASFEHVKICCFFSSPVESQRFSNRKAAGFLQNRGVQDNSGPTSLSVLEEICSCNANNYEEMQQRPANATTGWGNRRKKELN